MPNSRRRRNPKEQQNESGNKGLARMNTTVSAVRLSNPSFPRSRRVTMKYCDYVLPGSLSALTSQVVSASSIFDPNESGTGHQPAGRDEWTPFYNAYVVTGARLRATIMPSVSSNTVPLVAGIYISDFATLTATTWTTIAEQGNSVWRVLATDWDNANSQTTLHAVYDPKSFFGVKDPADNIDRIGGLVGASPADECFFHIFFQTISAAAASVAIAYEVEYDVLYTDPKEVPGS